MSGSPLEFRKYQGAGNDFIICDDRHGEGLTDRLTQKAIARLCDRHFGIGADGLMLIREAPDFDFEMVYFNADGAPSSLCGNGGRCIVRCVADLGLHRPEYRFLAVDGPHRATVLEDGQVSLEMADVAEITVLDADTYRLDTGSPHYLRFLDRLEGIDVVREGRRVRYSPDYAHEGINVNFVADAGDHLKILTYERGVEGETLACGTGITAAVLGALLRRGTAAPEGFEVTVGARGGRLRVSGRRTPRGTFTDLRLIGPAEFVFRGTFPAPALVAK